MASSSPASAPAAVLCALLALAAALGARAWPLSPAYYDESCPHVYDTVRRVIQEARVGDPRIPASLIRLHFHDCFVNVSSAQHCSSRARVRMGVWLVQQC
ncbi:hypothetical protein ABZP36_019731 [Zizania latifolia]